MRPRTWLRGLAVAAIVAVAIGCNGTVVPPVAPARPTVVYLCDYGYHSSLLLPVGHDGTFVEYLYGDWDWAVLNRTGVGPAVHAGLFSSRATLGRRYVYAPGAVPRPVTPPLTQTPIAVEDDLAQQLQRSLDRRWQAHADTAAYTADAGAYYLFVTDDEPYGAWHNCNRVTAEWLGRLGCQTGGLPILSHFAVTPPR